VDVRPEGLGHRSALFGAGCDDALVAVIDDTLYLDFG
jgi:hypothetical protein